MNLVVIVGPTGVGKSDIAIEVARRIDGEIISADSMQIYKGMDIGTAKASPEQRKEIRHHLLDIREPGEKFDVNEYQLLARNAINEIKGRNKIPILVGGTGLYIRAVLLPLKFPPTDDSGSIRKRYEDIASEKGTRHLWEQLAQADSSAASKIERTDKRRIIRALEVIELTGRPFSESYEDWTKSKPLYDALLFGLVAERHLLYDKINKRVDGMVDRGLVDEVKTLLQKGFYDALTAGQAIGYKEIVSFLSGNIPFGQAVESIKTATRNYAKRQLTWFRADPKIKWIDVGELSASQAVEIIVNETKEKYDQS